MVCVSYLKSLVHINRYISNHSGVFKFPNLINVYMLGQMVYSSVRYFCLKSEYKLHSITKWYSSSITPHATHYLSPTGLVCGFCHLHSSIGSIWDDKRNWLSYSVFVNINSSNGAFTHDGDLCASLVRP